MPRISVILPVYNASQYILEALESLSNQTFADFEILAINDGSIDNSLDLLMDYARKEPRLRVISRENRGLPKTLNEGIDLASGEYIARMDADDICLPSRFEKQLKFIEDNNLDICGTQYEAFGSRSERSNMPIYCDDCYFRLLLAFTMAHPSFLGKSRIFQKYKYNEEFKFAQDYELCCRMALDKVKMGNCPDFLLMYRYSANSITSTKTKEQNSYALATSKKYWSKFNLSSDLAYPICVLDFQNNNINDLKNSIRNLIKLQNKIKFSNYMNEFILSMQLFLIGRLCIYGLNNVLPFLKRIPNLKNKLKIIYSLIAVTKIMNIKSYINKIIPYSLKQRISCYMYSK